MKIRQKLPAANGQYFIYIFNVFSLETIDIETSEVEEAEEKTGGQEITVDNTNQMNVRKSNSLPMEVT